MNRAVVLASRLQAMPQAEHFALEELPVAQPTDGQIVVRNHYLSVDPAMRGWLSDANGYSDPIHGGSVMRAFAVGGTAAIAHHSTGQNKGKRLIQLP